MYLRVYTKTGFVSESPCVVIYRFGKPFFAKKNRSSKLEFNLPKGKYEVVFGNLKKMEKPVEYKMIDIPAPNHFTKFPNKIKIIICKNPNKCTVDLNGKYYTTFYFDKRFRDASRYCVTWICGHELGHYFYRGQGQISEQNCDHFAANLMLDIGYNPSQIDAAIGEAISNGYLARIRKDMLYENLLEIQ